MDWVRHSRKQGKNRQAGSKAGRDVQFSCVLSVALLSTTNGTKITKEASAPA
jgi:hypothetical protein